MWQVGSHPFAGTTSNNSNQSMVSKEQDWKLRYFALTRTRSNIAASIDKIRTLCIFFGSFLQLCWYEIDHPMMKFGFCNIL